MLGGLTEKVHFPSELLPLAIVRMFSASAATGLALDVFKEYGTDSYIGAGGVHYDGVYGDGLLYYEHLFYGSEGEENPLHATGGAAGNGGGDRGQCVAGGKNGI